ncbi:MAG TPA: decaprenyl-phosphate phosphoribosyltransferase [Planctomycetota bacterium]|nr:decaprenyl-phosphate phosphoribosyltransferase [Planctomycetota bacterium]
MQPLALLRAMRPHQWTKNLFVLAAVLFARGDQSVPRPDDWGDLVRSLYAFAAFCLAASAVYLLNDVIDVESDRVHPQKRNRPIARGAVSVPLALGTSAVCVAGAFGLALLARGEPRSVLWYVGAYLATNLVYTLKAKQVALLDVFFIAVGFLFRVEAGGAAAHSAVSHWLLLCTLFLALFLALCKRRSEIDLLGDERGAHRANLAEYTVGFLDQATTMLAAVTIVCYTMYTVSDETAAKFGADLGLVKTVPFVVFGMARYLMLVGSQRGGGSPTRVLLGGDALFVGNAVIWLAVVVSVLYGGG